MLVEILPRIGAKPGHGIFGPSFLYCIANSGEGIRVFVDAPVSPETLQSLFGVRRSSIDDLYRVISPDGGKIYVSEARLKRPEDFWHGSFYISDLPGLVNRLTARACVCVSFTRDPGLASIFRRRASSLMKKAIKYNNPGLKLLSKELSSRVSRGLWHARLWVLACDKMFRGEVEKIVEEASSLPIRWLRGSAKTPEELGKILKVRRISLWERLFGERSLLVSDEEGLRATISFPDPSLHRVGFVRGYPLPMLIPERRGEKSFRIGVLEDGREIRLGVEDLYRHVYIIGQTGSGKTTFIKTLVHRLRELGGTAVVVIDPHGDMARELAEEIPESLYLHPLKSPFGLNPLDLPKHESRDFAITIAIDILLEMFKEVLKLMETAVNVKYLLQVLLRAFYSKTDSPTMAHLYNAILALYRNELDLDVDDTEWKAQMEALQNMQDQTFISALSRLEPYAHDKLLMRLTSRTTIDVDKILSPGSVTIFSIPKADLGESLARLVASTIVMKLWFEVLARARLGRPRTPVFLVIDEFQFVSDLPTIDTILSEARKYGLHLVIAHQHTKQIPDPLLQSIMSNCAVKIAFQVGGADIKRLSSMDASFADAVAKALTGLTVGRAVVKLTARAGEQQPPPVVVVLDRVEHRVARADIYTSLYDPGEPARIDLAGMLNPVLKYIEPVEPLEFLSLYSVYRDGEAAVSDLAARLGARREDMEDAINGLAAKGYVEVSREGNKRVVSYSKGLFRGLREVAPSREGRALARRVLLHYAGMGYVVAPARQDPALPARPDLVAISVDRSTWRPLYSQAVAIEIETCNELEAHPEQVVRNWYKESTRDFAEIHVWAPGECFGRLEELYREHRDRVGRVKIFNAGPLDVKAKQLSETSRGGDDGG